MRRFRRFRLPALGAWFRWVVLFAAVTFLMARLADMILLGPLEAVAETEARARGVEAINRVLLGAVGNDLDPEDLIVYEKDQQGRIAAYRVNTQQVNQVAAKAATAVQAEFRRLSEGSFRIPLGALSGSRLLGTTGPTVPVRLMPIGTVAINVKQEFNGEGINQTRHRIWLTATANVRVVLPVLTREIVVTADVPLSETVIVGAVPSGFYGGNVGGVTVPVSP